MSGYKIADCFPGMVLTPRSAPWLKLTVVNVSDSELNVTWTDRHGRKHLWRVQHYPTFEEHSEAVADIVRQATEFQK